MVSGRGVNGAPGRFGQAHEGLYHGVGKTLEKYWIASLAHIQVTGIRCRGSTIVRVLGALEQRSSNHGVGIKVGVAADRQVDSTLGAWHIVAILAKGRCIFQGQDGSAYP